MCRGHYIEKTYQRLYEELLSVVSYAERDGITVSQLSIDQESYNLLCLPKDFQFLLVHQNRFVKINTEENFTQEVLKEASLEQIKQELQRRRNNLSKSPNLGNITPGKTPIDALTSPQSVNIAKAENCNHLNQNYAETDFLHTCPNCQIRLTRYKRT